MIHERTLSTRFAIAAVVLLIAGLWPKRLGSAS
jgi:hypothetical protein